MHTPFEADAEGFELLHSDNESDTGEVQERPHGFPRTLSSDWTHASGFDASDVLKAFTSGAQCGDSSSAVQSRNAFFVWTFVSYFCWGILTELYSDLFVEVIDKNNYGSAAFYSTVAMSTYSITGFLWSPVMATLSDTIGRKAVFIISACLNAVSGIFMGLVPSNWVFISMAALQGLGGKNAAVGYALLADYNAAVPLGWTGSKDDDIFHQWVFWIIRLGAAGPQLSTQDSSSNHALTELTILFNWVNVLQTAGLVVGIFFGDFLYNTTNSLTWSVAASGFGCVPMIIVLAFFMPETLPVGRRKLLSFKQIWHSINAQRAIIYQTFQKRPLGALILVNLIIQLSMVPLRNVALYWGQWKFGWSTNTQAYFLGVTIVSSLIGSILGPRLLLPTGIENFDAAYYYSRMVIIMASIAAAACIALSLVTTTYGVIISVFFFSVGTGCTPALSAQISAEAHAGEQGQVQGINSAVSSLAWAVGIYAYWGMFDTFIDDEFSFDDDANATHTTVVLGGVFWMFNMCIMIVVIVLELWVALNQGSKTKNDPEQRLLLAEMTDAQAS